MVNILYISSAFHPLFKSPFLLVSAFNGIYLLNCLFLANIEISLCLNDLCNSGKCLKSNFVYENQFFTSLDFKK
ncbi:hypothetical protein MFC_01458 [Mesomycoplasma flocculare ATCC 27716]|nr:hypothetical protein MFC_01458 [Mesomycoplasma flocculare ATCC 27716]